MPEAQKPAPAPTPKPKEPEKLKRVTSNDVGEQTETKSSK